jgi:serine/threonine protein phosphatase PrpC
MWLYSTTIFFGKNKSSLIFQSPGNHFFAVCDGHGQFGHIISNLIEKKLPG